MNNRYQQDPVSRSYQSVDVDEGLRSYMVAVYTYMALGLALTGAVSFFASQSQSLMSAIFGSPLKWVVLFAPLGIVFFLSARLNSMAFSTARLLFWAYSSLVGLSLSCIFLIYTGQSIARIFFITASVFAGMGLYGYTTKKDLSSFGSFLIMGCLGIFIAGIVNIFLQSSAFQMLISFLGVLIFTGLTAYDTQVVKELYDDSDDHEVASKKALFGALTLYMDFIGLFVHLLRLFGERR